MMNKKNKKLLSKANKEKKRSSLEKIKRKRRRELFIISSIFIVIIAGISFMFSSFVKLKNIEVSGEHQISKEQILEAGNINSDIKTWTIKDEEVKNNIQNKYNIFKSVSVESHMPSTITIKVEEYRFIAQNKKNDGNYELIMENGEVYNGEVTNNYTLPILENFNDDEAKLNEVYKNLAELKVGILSQISEIINNDDDTLTIYMKDGQKVKVLRASFSEKMNYYDEMSTYITDKSNTTLNLVNGAYLETKKSSSEREKDINSLLSRSGSSITQSNNSTTSENSTTPSNNSSSNQKNASATQNSTSNTNNTNQSSTNSTTSNQTTTTRNSTNSQTNQTTKRTS